MTALNAEAVRAIGVEIEATALRLAEVRNELRVLGTRVKVELARADPLADRDLERGALMLARGVMALSVGCERLEEASELRWFGLRAATRPAPAPAPGAALFERVAAEVG